jgi:hypothetical protein
MQIGCTSVICVSFSPFEYTSFGMYSTVCSDTVPVCTTTSDGVGYMICVLILYLIIPFYTLWTYSFKISVITIIKWSGTEIH